MSNPDPILTIIMVSYNTADLTLTAIRTCLETTRTTPFRLVVLDNASTDGSADAIAAAFPPEAFPQVELIRCEDNLGFARANNVVAAQAETEFLLLLNPDTECFEVNSVGAVDAVMNFAQETPRAGIWGGRTVFPDGSLNSLSCAMRITLWSTFCQSFGLTAAFPSIELFCPEAMGSWQRDTVREVDIVIGCFLLIRRDLWEVLGGFDLKYFMYGEESDLCLRAKAMGYQPMVTPDAEIMHIVGASTPARSAKRRMVLRARMTLIRQHWPAWQVPFGAAMVLTGIGLRRAITAGLATVTRSETWKTRAQAQADIWRHRHEWLAGYTDPIDTKHPVWE